MKRTALPVLIVLLGLFAGNAGFAQVKIGYISIQELVTKMPEFKKATTELEELEKALIQQNEDYRLEYQRLDSLYATDSLKWNAAVKEVKKRELNAAYLKAINFNKEAQQMMERREGELVAPIQQKALQTAQAVAKENGYSYILSKEQLIASPPGDDILNLALKKLNIPVPAPTPEKK
jgi:outer membrane protein